jgi:hypothetical protein
MGKKRNAYRMSVRMPEGKRPLGRPRHTCVDNIKMDLRETGPEEDSCGTIMNLWVP